MAIVIDDDFENRIAQGETYSPPYDGLIILNVQEPNPRKRLPPLESPLNYPECLDRIVLAAEYRAEYEINNVSPVLDLIKKIEELGSDLLT